MSWLAHRLLSDFWPVDKATVAPNLVASAMAFSAGWMFKGRQLVSLLNRHHAEQMSAHRATQEKVSNADGSTPGPEGTQGA